MQAMMAKETGAAGEYYADAHLRIDFQGRRAILDARPLELTNKEFDLLAFLASHPGMIVSSTALLTHVWGYSTEVRTRTLDVHLSRVRKTLGPYGDHYLERVFRMGCRFQPFVENLPLTA